MLSTCEITSVICLFCILFISLTPGLAKPTLHQLCSGFEYENIAAVIFSSLACAIVTPPTITHHTFHYLLTVFRHLT